MQYIDFESELNDKQYEAVTTRFQHVQVIAGAGSGKTRVLTYRIAYLINQFNVLPWTILAITFTNKVANEMKQRLVKMIPDCQKDLSIKTFHSFCAYFLRREISVLGFPRSFTILDEEDQEKIVKDIVQEMGFKRGDKIVGKALSYIGSCKLEEKYPDDFEVVVPRFEDEKTCYEIYARYEEEKTKCLSLDFDDLILKTIQILEEYSDIRSAWQNRIDHILIDEFQDTNDVEYKLISLLKRSNSSLYVVGDPDQTIYTWRGANPNIMSDIEKDFPDMEIITLNQNYRSTQVILDSANKLIAHNAFRRHKDLFTKKVGGDKIIVRSAPSSRTEADFVAREILSLVNTKGYKYSDIALLYRSNYLTLDFEKAFMAKKIPYSIYGGLKFFQRMEVKDVLAYFRLIINTKDDISFERIINVPRRKIGDKTVAVIKAEAQLNKMSLYEYIKACDSEISGIPEKAINSLKSMIFAIDNTRDKIAKYDEMFSRHLEDLIYSVGYQQYLSTYDENSEERMENVKQLFASVREFLRDNPEATFDEYLQNISLLSAQDDIHEKDSVQLMTVHTAKGLEFPVVFIVKFNQGVFPNERAMLENAPSRGIQEERRLAYVAITRAMKKLYMTCCSDFNYVVGSSLKESDFIKESGNSVLAPTSFFETSGSFGMPRSSSYNQRTPSQNNSFSTSAPIKQDFSKQTNNVTQWAVGDIVIHKKLGKGIVKSVDEDGALSVDFEEHGTKLIMGNHPAVSKGGNDA